MYIWFITWFSRCFINQAYSFLLVYFLEIVCCFVTSYVFCFPLLVFWRCVFFSFFFVLLICTHHPPKTPNAIKSKLFDKIMAKNHRRLETYIIDHNEFVILNIGPTAKSAAKGRTNIELREQFILADGVSQTMAAFKSKPHSAQQSPGSASPVYRGSPGPITKVGINNSPESRKSY